MADTFDRYTPGLTTPATHAFAITPHDTTELAVIPRALYVSAGGDLVVVLADDSAQVTLTGVVVGTILPIRPKLVKAATSATVVGLY